MRRLFSGSKTPEIPSPPRVFSRTSQSSDSPSPSLKKSWSSSNLNSKLKKNAYLTNDSSADHELSLPTVSSTLSPELIPIVTLLAAQAHRRYQEGVFLILHDLKNDGTQANRIWKEVYGVLIGTQLALWGANELAEVGNDLKDVASKPTYINFTDSIMKPLNSSDSVVTESNQKLEHVLAVSTTLKNRYFLKFSDKDSFNKWNAAIRLSLFECTALQEAYTAAFLSSRGSKLGDIKVVLADTKFDYEDWVSVRFGAGMPWKRCYAVISQSSGKKKQPKGKISFFESEKKTKKVNAMATVLDARAVYTVYPSSTQLIDSSTIIKLEGSIAFSNGSSKKSVDSQQDVDIFIMPEKHQAVPGYDTVIRFIIPTMNTFRLYGRPKKLIASKDDPSSLLFGLPTLPHIYYLNAEDIYPIANSSTNMDWTNMMWRDAIKDILAKKISQGYAGTGSSSSLTSDIATPVIGSSELFGNCNSPLPGSTQFFPNNPGSRKTSSNLNSPINTNFNESSKKNKTATNRELNPARTDIKNSEKENLSPYNNDNTNFTKNLTSQQNENSLNMNVSNNQQKSSNVPFEAASTGRKSVQDAEYNSNAKISHGVNNQSITSDLGDVYEKYSTSPFGRSQITLDKTVPQSIQVPINGSNAGAYERYVGHSKSKTFEISDIDDSSSSVNSAQRGNNQTSRNPYPMDDEEDNDLVELSRRISQIGGSTTSFQQDDYQNSLTASSVAKTDNIFDPDFVEQNNIYASESNDKPTPNYMFNNKDGNNSSHSVNDYVMANEYPPNRSVESPVNVNNKQPLSQPQYSTNISMSGGPMYQKLSLVENNQPQQVGRTDHAPPNFNQQLAPQQYNNRIRHPTNISPQKPYGNMPNMHTNPNMRNPNMHNPNVQQNLNMRNPNIHNPNMQNPNMHTAQNMNNGPYYNRPSPSQPQNNGGRPYPMQQNYQTNGQFNKSRPPPQAQGQFNNRGNPPFNPMNQNGNRQFRDPNSGNMPEQQRQMVNNGKVKPQPRGGFSQFMPSSGTTNNNNPYSQ
ncbi:hypothetical protein TPHA_0B04630 [Tetrapisispora phaffii CBS 4417]|uniref:PH domain-containing protein n=1 Tax=Tetrapisispora phaffii (strain ATCC 24235 / CBS 4417 / NBRC 1672 / NRRL Y-8282 / UCD 70-5) TaxID=1071381 RepID=G8BQ51_TETPH|nr:hypothetical protein TPHA_0B04630 [Tetrapisispora phaffii CBS 4417]CCE62132.1 hypothetical protein TPHA_0B04630 [Tetrapisispora phaffii CBS 4417]